MAATGLSRWQSQWVKRALQHFVINRFTIQVFSCSAKDCLRNEHFRTKLVNITGLFKIWPVLLKKVYAENMVDKKKLDSLPLSIDKWQTLILKYFLIKTPMFFFQRFLWFEVMADIEKNPFLLKFYSFFTTEGMLIQPWTVCWLNIAFILTSQKKVMLRIW